MCALENLSDEDKLRQSIDYVAMGQPLPESYRTFLKEQGLFDAILNPKGKTDASELREGKRSRSK